MRRIVLILVVAVLLGSCSGASDSATTPPPASTSDRVTGATAAFIAAKQVQFTTTVPNGRLVEVQSSHDIDLDQPELVIEEINRIFETA